MDSIRDLWRLFIYIIYIYIILYYMSNAHAYKFNTLYTVYSMIMQGMHLQHYFLVL